MLSDVERICDSVAVLEKGAIVMRGSVDELKRLNCSRDFTVETAELCFVKSLVERFPDAKQEGDDKLIFNGGEELMREVLSYIAEKGISISTVERLEPSIEALFMEVIKK